MDDLKPSSTEKREPLRPVDMIRIVRDTRQKVFDIVYEPERTHKGKWFRPHFSAFWAKADALARKQLIKEVKVFFDAANVVERLFPPSTHGRDKSARFGITETEQHEAFNQFFPALDRFEAYMNKIAEQTKDTSKVGDVWHSVRDEIHAIRNANM